MKNRMTCGVVGEKAERGYICTKRDRMVIRNRGYIIRDGLGQEIGNTAATVDVNDHISTSISSSSGVSPTSADRRVFGIVAGSSGFVAEIPNA
jgi:hypothetical protein